MDNMEKMIQYWAIAGALKFKVESEQIDVAPNFHTDQASMYVLDGYRDGRISDHTLQVVAALRNNIN